MLLYIFEAKRGCKKKSLNKLSLAADLLKRLVREYSIYVEVQAGLRKGMGTSDIFFVLNKLIAHCLNKNNYMEGSGSATIK